MALELGALREALLAAGTPNDLASKAAAEVALYDSRLANIDLKIEKLDGRITLVNWQLVILIGGVASLVIKAFA